MGIKISLPVAGTEQVASLPSADPASSGTVRAEGGSVMDEIAHEVKANKIILYMKGTPEQPMCGFSARAVHILNQLGRPYASVDILVDPEKRQAIKEYSDWPTIPQLYVNGEFIGGSDIMMEMAQSGELEQLVEDAFKG